MSTEIGNGVKYVAVMNGHPIYNGRVSRRNVNLGDILHYCGADKNSTYSMVIGTSYSAINVINLQYEILENSVRFYITNEIKNVVLTKNRETYKVINIKYI